MRGVLRAVGAPVAQVPHDATTGTTKGLLSVPLDKPTISGNRVPEVEFATAISWEIFFGGRVNEGVEMGGSIIINPTNGSSYRGTILQTQQLASSRLRAIEMGRWVAQVSPTGFSAFVTNTGRLIERTKIGDDAVIIADVPLRDGRTWYSQLGDAPVIIVLLLGFALGVSRATSGRRRAKPTRR
jgi:apolipoprotein N-acyltransferase